MATAMTGGYVRPEMLADTQWLKERLDDPNVRIIDCRNDPADYQERHIPGAVYMNCKQTKTGDGVHILTPEEAARTFSEMGIGDENEVVVYDAAGPYSARVWWTLYHYGHRHVRILNGGWNKWVAEGYPVTREIPRLEFAAFTPAPHDDMVTADEVERRLDAPDTNIFDARNGVEYFGILEKLGYKGGARRGGHIPSARWVNWSRSLEKDYTMKPAAELEKTFRREGYTENQETVVYCETSARSAHQLFAFKLLDHNNVKNYDGSWKEWGNSERPIGDTPHLSRLTEAKLIALGALVLGALLPALIYTVSKIKG